MPCEFITQLSKLRKSAAEAVDNTQTFDPEKEYLHVKRYVELELRSILRQVNESGRKSLVLLCGSAGDGKSHIISYLKHIDSEGLLEGYELYNDATESDAPTLKAIDTLAQRLERFDDEHYQEDDGYKMILAVNLGMLNNFIDSEQGKKYTALKAYVEHNKLFVFTWEHSNYHKDSVFQHLNFSDYQVFSLMNGSIATSYVEDLLERVFQKTENNPFYQAYVNATGCTLHSRCPVRHNYEYLLDAKRRRYIVKRIVEVVIKDKTVVSTRDILNLVFDLIVHPGFDKDTFCNYMPSQIQFLEQYIHSTTPMLLNAGKDTTVLLDNITHHDPLRVRREKIDNDAIHFHSLESIEIEFNRATEGTPYEALKHLTDINQLGALKPELKKDIYQFIIRTQYIDSDAVEDQDQRFEEFIRYLYCYNSGDVRRLRELYSMTKKAIFNWNGEFGDDVICIDDSNEYYWILERLHIKPTLGKQNKSDDEEIRRFSPTIRLSFCKESDPENCIADINMDYSLYEMIFAMRSGYRPTWQDKNLHTDFADFVRRIIEFGEKATNVTIIPKNLENKKHYTFSSDDFGAEFKVVKQ